MKVELTNKDSVILETGDKLCGDDIIVVPVLQDVTAVNNGAYFSQEGYAGLGEITANVHNSPLPIEVSGEDEMSGLLTSGENGGVYKYTGETSENYENGALYMLKKYAGLYETGSEWNTMLRSWDSLIADGVLNENGSVVKGKESELAGDLAIPNTITEIPSRAYYQCDALTAVFIPNSVTNIEDMSFYGCEGLTGIYITDLSAWCKIKFSANPLNYAGNLYLNGVLVTDLVIPDGVTELNLTFYGATCLTNVTIPDSVTNIGTYAFGGCSGLTTLTIPNSVTTIGNYAFNGCTGLTGVYITDLSAWCKIKFSANPLNYAGNLYLNGVLVTDLVIPDGVTELNLTFYGATCLTNVTIPDSVTSIGGNAFSGCTGLTALTIPNSVTNIGSHAFYECAGLTALIIPDSVTSIGSYAFYNCTGLTALTIPDSVTSIGSYAFYECAGPTTLTIPNSVTNIGVHAFYGCDGLTGVYITDLSAWCKIKFDSSSANPLNYAGNLYLNGVLVTDLVIPDGVTELNRTFCGATCLTGVTIPNSVTSIGNYAFSRCEGLTALIIPDSVTRIGSYAFEHSGLINITIGTSVNYIASRAFWFCTSLEKVTIKDLSAWCKITFADIHASPLYWSDDGLYLNGEFVTNVTIPDGVETIKSGVFYRCTSITSVTIPASVTKIEDYTFTGCTGLTEVHISDLSAWENIRFEEKESNPLYYAGNLYLNGELVTKITIPSDATIIRTNYSGCTSITEEVIIPASVKTIMPYAFYNCANIPSIKFESPFGWYSPADSYSTPENEIYLGDTTMNAKLLSSSKATQYWRRSPELGITGSWTLNPSDFILPPETEIRAEADVSGKILKSYSGDSSVVEDRQYSEIIISPDGTFSLYDGEYGYYLNILPKYPNFTVNTGGDTPEILDEAIRAELAAITVNSVASQEQDTLNALLSWLANNATKAKPPEPLAGTWLFNETLTSLDSSSSISSRAMDVGTNVGISFSSNGIAYGSMRVMNNMGSKLYVLYGGTFSAGYKAGAWTDDACRTIEISSSFAEITVIPEASAFIYTADDFLTWLQANATKQD